MSLLDMVKQRKSDDNIVESVNSGSTYSLSISTDQGNIEAIQKDDVQTFKDYENFKTLEELCEQLREYEDETQPDPVPRKEINKTKKERSKKRKLYRVTDSCLCKCLERCINDKTFYSVKSVRYLIKKDLINSLLHKLVVECYTKYDDLELLQTIVLKLDINEELVVQIVQFVLKNTDEETCRRLLDNEQMESCGLYKTILKRLVAIFTVEIQKKSLKEQLKLLESKEAMVLLKILQYLVKQISLSVNGDEKFNIDISGLSEMKILVWIDALISAHTITFATNNSMKSTIKDLGAIANDQLRFYQTINELTPFVDVFEKVFELPPPKRQNYSIETITL